MRAISAKLSSQAAEDDQLSVMHRRCDRIGLAWSVKIAFHNSPLNAGDVSVTAADFRTSVLVSGTGQWRWSLLGLHVNIASPTPSIVARSYNSTLHGSKPLKRVVGRKLISVLARDGNVDLYQEEV